MKPVLHNLSKKYSSLFRPLFMITLVITLTIGRAIAQNELDVINNWLQYSNAPNSLYHHIADQAYDLLAHRAGKVAKLNSLSCYLRS